jgi:uncharacterized protein (UPF0262 family)
MPTPVRSPRGSIGDRRMSAKESPRDGAREGAKPDAKMHRAKRLTAVVLDEASIGRSSPDQEQECSIAIYDLIERNSFAVPGHDRGPYRLTIALHEKKLVLQVTEEDGAPVIAHLLSLTPFRRVVRDYFMLCDSYYGAIRTRSASEIEAIDMGRRSLHDEAAALLVKRLQDKIEIDFDTARRLFTLIAALHWKG